MLNINLEILYKFVLILETVLNTSSDFFSLWWDNDINSMQDSNSYNNISNDDNNNKMITTGSLW